MVRASEDSHGETSGLAWRRHLRRQGLSARGRHALGSDRAFADGPEARVHGPGRAVEPDGGDDASLRWSGSGAGAVRARGTVAMAIGLIAAVALSTPAARAQVRADRADTLSVEARGTATLLPQN